ncbi:hypothetical protein CLG96_09365 [Sphingomonas oleivorans]|uniref:VanZ family protein n=1 Tax=Sphingomonas oleivorans TaxID=1735121 RepID=A0A2T5FYK5_9SPHN|nr:hypothetical protein [Sphingomonas oleivorans]PTQ11620.1 hypothetical protein CLG96_09365 [Sphingomonas oleivorans]
MTRIHRFFAVACWLAIGGAYMLSIMPEDEAPKVLGWDKAQHMLAFFTITLLFRLGYPRFPVRYVIGALGLFGALIEFSQMVPLIHRDSSVWDWVADMIALFAALLVARPIVAWLGRWRMGWDSNPR